MSAIHRLLAPCRIVVAAALLALPAAAALAQNSVDDLRYRVATLEAELATLRNRAAGGGMLERLDRLEQEIRALTGKVEEVAHQQRRIAEDAERRFADIEFRLTELEGGDVSALSPPAPLGGIDGSNAASSGGAPAAEVSISERDELDRAIADVEQGRYDQAEERLRRFLSTYGQTPLRAEALLWLGESQLTRGDYRDAARNFLEAYNADLQGKTAPRTLYRLGVTLGRLGQSNDACLTLREVGVQFPDAPGTLLDDAEDEADRLGCG